MHNEPLRWTRTSYRLVDVRRKGARELLSRNISGGPSCERREIARRRTEEKRVDTFHRLRATTTAADPPRDCASSSKKIGPPSKMGACDALEPHC
jgi:hypothetical protein